MSQNRLILFDIDGTLIDTARAGHRAFNRAFEDITGIEEGFRGMNYAGKTDLQIFFEGIEKLGFEHSDGFLERFVEAYVVRLRDEITRPGGSVKPGVFELLEALEQEDRYILGLLTGNLEHGALIKLGHYGLGERFALGAFGSDHADRNYLLPIAVERLEASRQISVAHADCVVVGDTPRDIECAHAHDALCIAVATGPYSVEALLEEGADLVVAELTEIDRIMGWLEAL